MSSVRIANNHIGGVLEVAAEYVENGVRRATNDCVQKTPKESVVAHPDAGRSRQGLVAENVAVTVDGIGCALRAACFERPRSLLLCRL